MNRREFLKISALSIAVLAVVPGWVFAKREEPMITLPNLRPLPGQYIMHPEGWYEITVICTHQLDEFDEVGRVASLMTRHPSEPSGYANYAVCDGRKIPLRGHEELGRLLAKHRNGLPD